MPGAQRSRIAWCEAGELTPERDAGSRAVADIVDGFRTLGHEIVVFAESEGMLVERVTRFAPDVIVISRPGPFVRLQPRLAVLGAPIIYLAHDLHFVRIGLGSAFEHTQLDPAALRAMTLVERECFLRADLSLLPTDDEVDRVRAEFPGAACRAIDYFSMPEQPLPESPPDGLALVFVGGYAHAPNRDGVSWFLSELWPRIHEQRPDATVTVCGDWPSRGGGFAALPGVEFTGVLSDDALDAVIASSSAGIVPLRFGSGMKRKVLHYLSHGVPVIGSRFATEGLARDPSLGGVILAESFDDWMAAIERIERREEWLGLSRAGAAFVRSRFAPERFRAGLASALAALR